MMEHMPALPNTRPQADRNGSFRARRGAALRSAFTGGVLALGLALANSGPALAQATPTVSQPVVQKLPGGDGMTLNAALGRLGRNPRDVDALIDAGNAALAMGDVDAATGFYRRADQVAPGNPRVKAGLAGAMVRNGDPFGAIPLFDEAERAGALDSVLAADRGLAYDLVGDNASAQRYYRQALTRGSNDDVSLRLALSQAISGDRRGADATLAPLLQRQDKAAWRTRAFALAILGQPEEAVSIAKTMLPASLAEGIAPYLRYMPRLTPAQQAAAANFGAFPLPSEIGRDDPRVARYAPAGGRRPAVASADAALVPKGQPLGRDARGRTTRQSARAAREAARAEQARAEQARVEQARVEQARAEQARLAQASAAQAKARQAQATAAPVRDTRVAPPNPMPARQSVPASPALAVAAVPAAPVPAAVPPVAAPSVSQPPVPAATPAPAYSPPATASAAPGFDLGRMASSSPPASMSAPVTPHGDSPAANALAAASAGSSPAATSAATPARAAPPEPPRPSRQSLAEAFSEFSRPSEVTPAAGAVDMRRIRPARPKVEAPAKPPPPSHPSRIWVQVATGRDKGALAFDWRRLIRKAPEAFRGKKAFVSDWGQTNRLLTGPFESTAAANAFLAQLRRGDIDGSFLWTSPAGQVVDDLSAR